MSKFGYSCLVPMYRIQMSRKLLITKYDTTDDDVKNNCTQSN